MTLTFGQAVEALKDGKKVTRAGWNGKAMYLIFVAATRYELDAILGLDQELRPFIGMVTADNTFVPWLASQTDILAEDWVVAPL